MADGGMEHARTELEEIEHEHESVHGGHPSVKEYIRIGVALAALTGIEVAIKYSGTSELVLVISLFFFAAVKFTLVVLWFMHLRFDDRRYARFFVMGLALAFTLYLIVLATFGAFRG